MTDELIVKSELGVASSAHSVEEVLGEKGLFVRSLPHFTPRRGQLKLAKKVREALEDGELLIAEAGTGTGKTFAYLIPALLSGKVTVVSTASKALQDQLMHKDLPVLYKYLGLEPDFMVLKGFSNYLCQKKAYEFIDKYGRKTFDLEDEQLDAHKLKLRRLAERIKELIESTELKLEKRDPLCDYAEVNSRFAPEIQAEITMDSKLCRAHGRCPFATHCFAHLARAKATASRLVIVNHALFFAALAVDDVFEQLRPPVMLPKYQNIIFDEAHELPEIGRNFLSSHLGSEDVELIDKEVSLLIAATPDLPLNELSAGMVRIRESFKNMQLYLNTRFQPGRAQRHDILELMYEDYDSKNRDPTYQYQKQYCDFWQLSREIYRALRAVSQFLLENEDFNADLISPVATQLKELLQTLTLLMQIDKTDAPEFGSYVGCCEFSRRHFDFKLTPLEISRVFGHYLEQCEKHELGVVMTSATLSVSKSCEKFKHDLGADESSRDLIVPSHFDYKHHSCLLVSEDFPDPADELRMDKILADLKPLLEKTRGGIFILTTSVAAVNRTAQCLQSMQLERRIFQQNTELSNTEMLKSFKADGQAILIGTSSFWAGVDVPGQALSLVIIDKLPFDPPDDPLLKARFNWYDFKQGKNKSFHDLYLPEAVINLRQGVGRLVRSDEDTGVMVICDPRLLAKTYGKVFLKSLPPMQRTENVEQTLDFMQKVGISNG
ncbi:MAG: ATP-dependent DNA helicase [Succinivibrio sp.]|nr:ATP-dependent DNA helicase [Succinivibrio sp.]